MGIFQAKMAKPGTLQGKKGQKWSNMASFRAKKNDKKWTKMDIFQENGKKRSKTALFKAQMVQNWQFG